MKPYFSIRNKIIKYEDCRYEVSLQTAEELTT